MNDLPRAILKEMIGRYGKSLAQDPVRCEGLLRDSCSRCNKEIFVLVNAARQRVPADLITPRHALPLSLMKGFLAKRLQDELGFSEEASRWAVESWADALGITGADAPEEDVITPVPIPRVSSMPIFTDNGQPGESAQCVRWKDDLKTGTLSVRLAAVSGLIHTPGSDCLRVLIGALDNSHVRVREAAFDAIMSREKPAIPPLIEELGNSSEGIVWRSAIILGGIGAENASGALIRLLDRPGRVQLCAIWALGEIRSREATTPLFDLLNHSDPALREEASLALKKIGAK